MSVQPEAAQRSRSLSATFVRVLLILTLGSLLIVSLTMLVFYSRAIQESVDSQLLRTAESAASTVSGVIEERFSELEAAVSVGGPGSASEEERQVLVASLLGLDPAFRQLALLDAQGQELTMVSRTARGAVVPISERTLDGLFAQVRQGNRYVSKVYVDEATSEPLIVIAVPATNVFGELEGILCAEINLKFMWDLVGQLKIGETGRAYVVNRQGSLVAFGDVSRVLRGENVSGLDLVDSFVHSSIGDREAVGRMTQGIEGTPVVGAYVSLGVPDWAVVTEQPIGEAFRSAIRNVVVLSGIVLAMLVLVGVVGVHMARRVAAPLLGLTATASRIAAGEMELQAAMEGSTEAISLATAFNSMTTQLRELIGSLEQRVAVRTEVLEASVDVSRATTSLLDPDVLVRQVVDLVRERFDLYYVGLFLVDEEGRFAVLHAGTGEAGQEMLSRGHRLGVGSDSMIGQCISNSSARIALDVGEEAVRFENPLLPDTRSELALPMRSRGRVIGAMTVQSDEESAFDAAYISVLQAMADQIAVAIDNARLYAESDTALAALEAAQRRYVGQAWTEYLRQQTVAGYRDTGAGIRSIEREVLPEAQRAIGQGSLLIGADTSLSAPITDRGQTIGALGFAHIGGDAQERPWSEDELAILEAVRTQFAQVADNLRLLDQTRRGQAREQAIGQVTRSIRQSLEVDEVLRTAAEQIRETLGLGKTVVRLAVPEQVLSDSSDGNEE